MTKRAGDLTLSTYNLLSVRKTIHRQFFLHNHFLHSRPEKIRQKVVVTNRPGWLTVLRRFLVLLGKPSMGEGQLQCTVGICCRLNCSMSGWVHSFGWELFLILRSSGNPTLSAGKIV